MVDHNSDENAKQFKPIDLPPLCDRPMVSVLMANYNYAQYIGEAIESMLAQTYENWELIVCDDGSTDNSREVIARHADRDPRVRLVAKENGGQASALNAAYSASQGEIICLLDADDLFHPEKIQKVVHAFTSSPRSGACLHRIIKMHRDGRTFGCPVPVVFLKGWVGPDALRGGGIPRHLPSRAMPEASGMSFRREVTNKIFPLPNPIRSMADGYICGTAQFVTEFSALPEVLGRLRVHGQNVTSAAQYTVASLTRGMNDMMRVVGQIHDFLLATYGQNVASQFRPEHNSLYCSLRVALHIVGCKDIPGQNGETPWQIARNIRPLRQRILAQILLLLPAPLSRKTLKIWRGISPTDALALRFARFVLRV